MPEIVVNTSKTHTVVISLTKEELECILFAHAKSRFTELDRFGRHEIEFAQRCNGGVRITATREEQL